MQHYDPNTSPDPIEWNLIDEGERVAMIIRWHQEAGADLPNEVIHATLHAVVESQAILGDETPVAAALDRLTREAVDRHEAIHCIGAALAEYLQQLQSAPAADAEAMNQRYFKTVETLSIKAWKAQYSE